MQEAAPQARGRMAAMGSDHALAGPRRWAIGCCAFLLLIYAVLAATAVRRECPTSDEGYHALAGWMHLWRGDYRLDTEDPPLWNELAALAAGPDMIHIRTDGEDWSGLPIDTATEFQWQVRMLFRTRGNDADAFVARFRWVMLAVALAFGAMLAAFTWRMGRRLGLAAPATAVAAVAATALLALDPNFLAHGALMKNDVLASAAMLGLTACAWSAGRRLSAMAVAGFAICGGIALGSKFTGPLMLMIAGGLLLVRAVLPWPWRFGRRGRRVDGIARRLGMALGVGVVAGVVALLSVWISYSLRFAPVPGPGGDQLLDLPLAARTCVQAKWEAAHTDGTFVPVATRADIDATKPPLIVPVSLWILAHHLLPQAFVAGLLYVYKSAMIRGTFLCGVSRCIGWWWYFPFAIAVKTPLATVAAGTAAVVAAVVWLAGFGRRAASATSSAAAFEWVWAALCLGMPPVLYLAAAMTSNLNLGLRHVLPVYPPLFVLAGLMAGRLWSWRPAVAVVVGVAVIGGLAAETAAAYPHFIPFFNAAAGGARGGLRLLSDSNLDWGQDLPLLADWQRQHPQQRLYLAYFGTCDPAYYGIHYINVEDGYWAGPPPQPVKQPGVIAISATTLQGPYDKRINGQPYWAGLWKLRPFEVLGGSIYLFHYPPEKADLLPDGERLIGG